MPGRASGTVPVQVRPRDEVGRQPPQEPPGWLRYAETRATREHRLSRLMHPAQVTEIAAPFPQQALDLIELVCKNDVMHTPPTRGRWLATRETAADGSGGHDDLPAHWSAADRGCAMRVTPVIGTGREIVLFSHIFPCRQEKMDHRLGPAHRDRDPQLSDLSWRLSVPADCQVLERPVRFIRPMRGWSAALPDNRWGPRPPGVRP